MIASFNFVLGEKSPYKFAQKIADILLEQGIVTGSDELYFEAGLDYVDIFLIQDANQLN